MLQWKKLLNHSVWKHIGILAGASIVIIIAIFFFLKIYTLHGQKAPVPDFTGLTEQQLQHLIQSQDLRYTIIDSVYIDNAPKGIVVDQTPRPGDKVKKNRNIFFTINAWGEEQIVVPDLTDYSLRNAQEIVESYGLKVGELIYIPSEYTNLVLGQHRNGKPVEPGTMLRKGATIDLLVGRGLSNETTAVPNLMGMKLNEAKKVAQSVYLNLGAIVYADTIETSIDSLNAFVWRQNPPTAKGYVLNLGASIDVWLSIDYALHPDTIEARKAEGEQPLNEGETDDKNDAYEEEFF
jgi:eukaryotic-like serine/threonine-protein kinase